MTFEVAVDFICIVCSMAQIFTGCFNDDIVYMLVGIGSGLFWLYFGLKDFKKWWKEEE